jgi:hypothetical protein
MDILIIGIQAYLFVFGISLLYYGLENIILLSEELNDDQNYLIKINILNGFLLLMCGIISINIRSLVKILTLRTPSILTML